MRPSDQRRYHARARERGVNPIVYWLVRAILQPFFHLYFRLSRIGREHVPQAGPVIFTANHRSFIDPFVIGTITRRPIYYVAKRELFDLHPIVGRLLSALGAFPVNRGAGDADMIETAKAILARGDSVMMFPEGTRTRPGTLGKPKRGVGRLALESGAPVVPVAVIGTEAVRRGVILRPHKVRLRIGRPLTFPRVENASPQLAAAVTDRIWPMVMLQWEWLGGLPPLRRATIVGDGSRAARLASILTAAGLAVDRHTALADVVVFAVPAAELPEALDAHEIPPRAGVLVAANGLVPPFARPPAAYAAEHVRAWAVGAIAVGDPVALAAPDPAFRRQVGDALAAAGVRFVHTPEIVRVEPPDRLPVGASVHG